MKWHSKCYRQYMQRVSFECVALCCSVLLQHTSNATGKWCNAYKAFFRANGRHCHLRNSQKSKFWKVYLLLHTLLHLECRLSRMQAFERMAGTTIDEILKSRDSEKSTCYSIKWWMHCSVHLSNKKTFQNFWPLRISSMAVPAIRSKACFIDKWHSKCNSVWRSR